jgi:hypothetical protein
MNCFAINQRLIGLLEGKQIGLGRTYLDKLIQLGRQCFPGHAVQDNSFDGTIYIYSANPVPRFDLDDASARETNHWILGIQSFMTVNDKDMIRSVWNVCKEAGSPRTMDNLLGFMLRHNMDKNMYLRVDLGNPAFSRAFDLYARFGFNVLELGGVARIEDGRFIRMFKTMAPNETRTFEESKAYRYIILSHLIHQNRARLQDGSPNPNITIPDQAIVAGLDNLYRGAKSSKHKTQKHKTHKHKSHKHKKME